ncbi:MAG: hypothetical protein GXP31_15685 [Kiritimatiellaeota bacterium]|nr:hypothetical protein [Kiritimatiellota bacterium]
MTQSPEELYRERLKRYATALRNEKPDCVPIRPFVAEFTAKYCGYTCQEVTHDYEKAFDAVRRCAADFDWDAVVANMVYVWTGLTEAIGLKYYGVPGIEVPPDMGFQYREPPPEQAWMKPEEYDQLIDDPTGYLFNVWLPRVSADVAPLGEPVTFRNNLSFLKGGMAMLSYFNAFGPQIERLRTETGTVSAIAGILKAPFDIIADKLRGYIGLTMDVMERPDKVMAACEALAPHLVHVAHTSADPACTVPVGFWMHRGCVPFVTPETFDRFYWATTKPVIEELWARGHQVLFYAEGDWNRHLDRFAELPDQSIVYHVDQADIFETHRKIGHKFCLSGGIPNVLLALGAPQEVREYCRKVIEGVGRDGGYILDASAIVQNAARIENIQAMTEAGREFGGYNGPAYTPTAPPVCSAADGQAATAETPPAAVGSRAPGVCVPWSEKRAELPGVTGDEGLLQRVWEDVDALAYTYIWQCLLSF